jgi:hypothetical protein
MDETIAMSLSVLNSAAVCVVVSSLTCVTLVGTAFFSDAVELFDVVEVGDAVDGVEAFIGFIIGFPFVVILGEFRAALVVLLGETF